MKVLRNRLVSESNSDRIQQLQTSNKGGLITPNYIIIHFTAGRSPESSIQWFQNPTAKASAHLIIARDGTITQLIDFNRKAWHAGISSWGNCDPNQGVPNKINLLLPAQNFFHKSLSILMRLLITRPPMECATIMIG